MRRVTITLFDDERNALFALAQTERRDLREQAAYLIRRGLEIAGYLEPDAAALQALATEKEAGNAAANEARVGG